MKFLKYILKGFVVLLLLLNALILITGKTYLYKGIANTYLKGRKGPSIDEYRIFHNRTVEAGTPDPWPLSSRYNKTALPADSDSAFRQYQTIAFLVIKNDSIVYELYRDAYSDTSHTNSFSMGKSITSILAGIAIHEGKIKHIDQPVGDFLPEFKEGKKNRITVRHLLTMTSGLNFDEDYVNPLAYPAAAYYGNDLKKLTLKYDVAEEPGKIFRYLSGNTQLLGFVLEKATGMSLSRYASEKLWKPIGAEHPAYWSLDHENGSEKAYCCFNSNARDFARFGQLYLNKGNWKGKQIVEAEFAEQSVVPYPVPDEEGKKNERYGYSWWIIRHQNLNVFYARGILGQYIFVIPEKNMVVVRLGKKRDAERRDGHPNDVPVYLDAALKMFP